MTVALGAVGANRTLSYIAETVFGTTPATPVMKYVRSKVGAKFDLKRNTVASQEISPTRQVVSLTYGNRSGSGDIPFDFSYGSFDDFLEAVMGGTWTSNVLKIGNTKRSFSIEDAYPDISFFELNKGVVFTGFTLSVKPDAVVTGSFTHQFKDQSSAAVTAATSTTAANTNAVFDSFTGTMTEAGSAIAIVTGIDIKVDQAASASNVLFDPTAQQISLGTANVTGTIVVRFTNETLKAKFLAGTSTDLSFTLGVTSKMYQFDMSSVMLTSVTTSADEKELTQSFAFTAIYNTGDASSIMITRTP